MTVTVTFRAPSFSPPDKGRAPVTHEKGQASLVDTRGQLLVLDTSDIDLSADLDEHGRVLFGKPEMALIRHVLVTYAEGEWASAEVDRTT